MQGFRARVRFGAALVLTVLASSYAVAAAPAAATGPGRWKPIGPPGGSVSSVAVAGDGRTAYAGGTAGVYASVDGGRSWQLASAGAVPGAFTVRSPRAAPATVYAQSGYGLFASFDAARHWRRIDLDFQPFPGVYGFGVSDSNSAVVYFGASSPTSRFNVYGSSDAGATWHAGNGLRAPGDVASFNLVVDPRQPRVAYLGLGGAGPFAHGVFRTIDGGSHWSPAGMNGFDVLLLTVDRVLHKHLYAYARQANRPSRQPRIYTSADGGASWVQLQDNLRGVALGDLVADPLHAGTLYSFEAPGPDVAGRILKTTDGGTSWRVVQGAGLDQPPNVRSLAADPIRPGVLYAARDVGDRSLAAGLYQSADGGKSWIPRASGIQTQGVAAIALDPQTAGVVYAGLLGPIDGSPGGLVKTADDGATWTGEGFDGQAVTALVPDLDAPATLYASAGLVYRTVDAGGHWDALGQDGGLQLAVVGGTLLVNEGAEVLKWDPATANWEVFTGFDFAETFAAVLDGSATTIWFDDNVYIDSGFEPIMSVQPPDSFSTVLEVPGQSTAIVIDPRNPQEVVVTYRQDSRVPLTGGLFLSTDRGSHWKHPVVGSGGPLFTAAIDPFDPLHIAAGGGEGVFETRDGGDTWAAINDGLPSGTVFALQFSRQSPATLYAAIGGGGIYVLTPQ
ncbi:MAG TPA: hypothetical protein VFE33_04615 [Thermoanaerobaculia bacterium]|nr:hypothetical protein [Thermoanaerobaculia bacterium]